ncbi:Non-ribosomal peptide synthetase [Alloactinosynnema sp. L-07]|uniref:non-ribosomal peptide synthetase n=1 Tax=Alloactinosynnema sp. L-07 TaxID=1653480 RepID=UPI00065F0B13|nr:non-ribosomal peptide synthetase [Alloactinosynnema sp. L-07]CRK62217.1 Non-ribosomal peptide synthetase [Alloactinosynnema sp. L-07]
MLNLPQAEQRAFTDNEAPGPHLDVLHALSYRVAGAAQRLGILAQLTDEPRAADDIAAAVSADPRGTRILLDALVGFSYAERDAAGYRAAPGAKWLSTGYGTVFSFWHRVLFDQWAELERSIMDGKPAVDFYGWMTDNPDALAEFQAMLGELADAIVPELPLAQPAARRLLDVGGGHGRYARAFRDANPDLHVTVVDLPGARPEDLGDRIDFREADWLSDDLGSEYDIVLLFNVVHCLSPDRARDLLLRVGRAVRPGGTVLILEETTDVPPEAGGTGAAWVPMFSLNLFHTQGGQIYDAPALGDLLAEAGFGALGSAGIASAPTFRLFTATKEESRVWQPTVAQRQMLTFDRLFPGSTWHNVPLYARITGPLDLDALRGSLARCVRRHESLRTVYPGDVAQLTAVAPTLRELDLTGQGESALEALRDKELRTPFDLVNGPPLRVTLARLADDEHELIVVAHHIAVDGYSLTLLQRDLLDGYADPDGHVEELRYSAFAQRPAGSHELELAHWRAELADLPDPVALPFAASAADPGLAADVVRFAVPDEVSAAVREVAKTQRSSPFMVLMSAFAVLLRRYSGTSDLVIGTPVAGRDDPGTEDLVGCLVNMVPLRLRLADAATWSDVLGTVRSAALDAFDNARPPFAAVVDQLSPSRSASIHPVFQIAFAAPPALAAPSTVEGVTFAFGDGTSTESLFDIEVQVIDEGDGMRGYLKYRTALFTRDHMTGLIDHFLHLAGRLGAEPDARLANVPTLREADYTRAVTEWNDTATDYPRDTSLVELVQRQVDATPSAVAAVYGAESLTYRELDERANQLAHHLRSLGVGAETRVGLCLEFRADWVVAALAVLKAGGAYVPLDPAYPAARLEFMCADSGVTVVVAHESLRDRVTAPTVVTLDGGVPGPVTRPGSAPHPDNLAYVMYTSGSTGTPKGVGVTHRNIVRLVRDTNYVHFGPGDTVAQVSNLSFDAATFEIWGPLCAGGRIVGVPKDDLLSAPAFAKTLRDNKVDLMFLTTSLARQLAGEAPETFAGLRQLLVGGEQADPEMIARLRSVGGPSVHNAYGPTETTTFALSWEAGEVGDTVPIGRPIANSTAYVLDTDLHPAAPGLVGEIYLGGDGVARGYLGRPDLTAERFVPDPFGAPGSRMYRTGDLGRYRADGRIDCLGRADRQVKIRGFRIEPSEVEACLRETGAVRQVTVQVRDAQLIGYVVPLDPAASMADLLDALRSRLPDYLVPTVLVAMEALPVNANGKLDVSALPDPLAQSDSVAAEPTTEVERVVRAIWREVLGNPELGVHDDFFLLGGHSIKAGQVMTRIRAELKVPASLRLIFDNPTVASLSAALPQAPN